MKKLVYILSFLILLTACASKKNIVKTERVITRELDTLIKLPPKTAVFIPTYFDTVELFVDRETGIKARIYYETIEGLEELVVSKIEIETPEQIIPVKVKETIQESIKEKQVEGIPWFYKAALWIVIGFIVVTIVIKVLKLYIPGI